MNRHHLFRPIILASTIFILYLVGILTGILLDTKSKVNDYFTNLRYKLTPLSSNIENIVIVGITDNEYSIFGKKWAWKRDIYADLTYKLSKYNPAVLCFDFGFIGKDVTKGASDFLLTEAFKDAGNVIVGSYFNEKGEYILPEDIYRDAVLGFGFTNKPADKDSIIRKSNLFQRNVLFGNIIDYSFETKILAAYNKAPLSRIHYENKKIMFGSISIPCPQNGIIPLNYTARLHDFREIPILDVIAEKEDLSFIKDKIVLIGTVGELFRDIWATPLGKMPGIGIIANNLVMFLDRSFLKTIPSWINISLLIILSILTTFLLSRISIRQGTLVVCGTLLIFLSINFVLLTNNIQCDFFGIPLVLISIYLTHTIENYVSLLIQTFKLKETAIRDTLTGLSTRRYFIFRLENTLKKARQVRNLSIVLFRFDDFRRITAEMEPEKINSLIKNTAQALKRHSRKSRGFDLISRYAEFEFGVILHNTPKKGANAYAERIRKIVKGLQSVPKEFTLSAGICEYKEIKGKPAIYFIRCTEIALERASTEGGGKICIYDSEKDGTPFVKLEEERGITEIDLSYVAKELEDKNKQLLQIIDQLRSSQDELIRSARLSAVGRVTATIHHDLSKPVQNIKRTLDLIRNRIEKDLPGDSKELFGIAMNEVERLMEQCNKIRDLYKPAAVTLAQVKVNGVLEDMLNLTSKELIEKDIKLIKRLGQNLPEITINISDLKQALLNIILNGVQSMAQGGELEVATKVSEEKSGMIEILIRDTGCGIPKEDIDKIYKGFFTTKKDKDGTGLGVYSSLQVIERYGGLMNIESAVNKGTAVTIYLPVGT